MKQLRECFIRNVHPTQITIGLIEVSDKCLELAALTKKHRQSFVSESLVPAVRGPSDEIYITDHHHLMLAAWHMNVCTARFSVEADLSKLKVKRFWDEMIKNHWAHPINGAGKLCPPAAIPSHMNELCDDIYRSLSRRVRENGGYAKTPTAFAEFRWADLFRERVSIGPTGKDLDAAVQNTTKPAKSNRASELTGIGK